MIVALVAVWMGCSQPASQPLPEPEQPAPAQVPAQAPAASAAIADWQAPPLEAIPKTPLGDAIIRGRELFLKTDRLLPEYAPGNMACGSCHLDEGRRLGAAALVGVNGRFPKYMERTGAVITLQDRVNYCFTRSLAGNLLPVESAEMTEIVAYLAFLSQGAPAGGKIAGIDIPLLARMTADPVRGEALYAEKCTACHTSEGGGVRGAFPALWGPDSYSIGASMAREERAASFIHQFMPQNAPGTLSPQDSYDLSAFINSHARPDSPNKEFDWPQGGAPYDVPYDTKDHAAYQPPPLLKRRSPESAVVMPPKSVARRM